MVYSNRCKWCHSMTHYPGNTAVRSTEQLADSLGQFASDDPSHRLVEVDLEPEQYDEWHIPGAEHIDWETDINDGLGGKILGQDEVESLLGDLGITPETTVVLYGDRANWFAAHAHWVLKYYGHDDVQLLDGGRRKWEMEGYETATGTPDFTEQEYTSSEVNDNIRAYKNEVETAMQDETSLIDVRNPQEYRGDKPPAEIPETTDREGHIPSADNVPWGQAVDMDGTFKHTKELEDVYSEHIDNECGTISYCRIGERSSITWFVLHELLGHDVRNYDGSFSEWEADKDAPVATNQPASAGTGGDD